MKLIGKISVYKLRGGIIPSISRWKDIYLKNIRTFRNTQHINLIKWT